MRKMMTVAVMVSLALVGCVTDPPRDPQVYSCVVLYRCVGDEDMRARLALPCASDADEAEGMAGDAGMEAVAERCPSSWQYVRPVCERYTPATTCEPAP